MVGGRAREQGVCRGELGRGWGSGMVRQLLVEVMGCCAALGGVFAIHPFKKHPL